MGGIQDIAAGRRSDLDFLQGLGAVPREVARLHGLPDRWLGEAVLALARDARDGPEPLPGRLAEPGNARLLWTLVPEIARRLDCRLAPGEGGCAWLGDDGLRREVGLSMGTLSILSLVAGRGGEPGPIDLLSHGIGNGSPVAIALDRVAPPPPDADDHCASVVRETCLRRGHGPRTAWNPGMQTIRLRPRPGTAP